MYWRYNPFIKTWCIYSIENFESIIQSTPFHKETRSMIMFSTYSIALAQSKHFIHLTSALGSPNLPHPFG